MIKRLWMVLVLSGMAQHAGAQVVGGPHNDAASAVVYIEHEKVDAAFAKGSVLFDGHGSNYMVHASRRDTAGQAEVHTTDTDIIYVLQGSATFVTGGTMIDAKTISAGEVRGREISGGDARQLRKGDVIIVPAGTPHWFKDVPSPMTYYVVKVRGG